MSGALLFRNDPKAHVEDEVSGGAPGQLRWFALCCRDACLGVIISKEDFAGGLE